MKNRPFTIFLLPLLLLGQSQTFADDVSKGRDHFLKQCIGCHACNFSITRGTYLVGEAALATSWGSGGMLLRSVSRSSR